MRILDLDMDYFMTKVAHDVPETSTERLDEEYYAESVWDKQKVIDFIENHLGLSKIRKTPGRIVAGHNGALFFWKELINTGRLEVPFEVIHVDSHADLGLGTDSPTFIRKHLLKWTVEERPAHSQRINCFGRECAEGIADYLLFAVAYRWISKLTYCGNPNSDSDDYDVHTLKNFEEKYIYDKPVDNVIQLFYNPTMDCPHMYSDEPYKIWAYIDASQKEPEVPFRIIPTVETVKYNGDFDFIVFAQSPNYTPRSADYIIEVIRDYIDEI